MAVKSRNILFLLLTVFLLGMMSTVAQEETTTHTVSFDGIGLTFDASIGDRVLAYHEAATSPEQAGPFANPASTVFEIYSPSSNDLPAYSARFRVYHTADLAEYETMQTGVNALETLLTTRPDLTDFYALDAQLPYLPVLMHCQVIRARAAYIQHTNLTGVAYLTTFQAAAEPLLNTSFIYTVQAITTDGAYYIAADFAVTTDTFPTQIDSDFDVDAFSNALDAYMLESTATLNAAEAGAFSPSLDLFRAAVESMSFAG